MCSDIPDHYCPGCGILQSESLRYPWRFCQDCLQQAHDKAGKNLEFSNVDMSGGMRWRYHGEKEWRNDADAVICFIHSRPVIVREHRFGGFVAEPIGTQRLTKSATVTDLRN